MLRVVSHYGRDVRAVTIERGRRYDVRPQNPAAVRNRGRRVEILEALAIGSTRVVVRWLDSGRVGTVDASDLLPVDYGQARAA